MRRRAETLQIGADVLVQAVMSEPRTDLDSDAVKLAAFSIIGGLLQAMIGWTDGIISMTPDRFVDEFTDLATATMRQATGSGDTP